MMGLLNSGALKIPMDAVLPVESRAKVEETQEVTHEVKTSNETDEVIPEQDEAISVHLHQHTRVARARKSANMVPANKVSVALKALHENLGPVLPGTLGRPTSRERGLAPARKRTGRPGELLRHRFDFWMA